MYVCLSWAECREYEIFCRVQAYFRGERKKTYSIFFGFMTKHQRVHIIPVAVRARFCVRERFSAGRQKSLTPARTRAHYAEFTVSHISLLLTIVCQNSLHMTSLTGICKPFF